MQSLWRTVWWFLKRLTVEMPYAPINSLLGMYPEKTNSKRYMHPNDHSSTIYNSQDMEATSLSLSTEKWIKMWYIYTMEYSHKK